MSAHVPLDPQLAAIVAAIGARGEPPPFEGSAPESRERMRRAVRSARERTPPIAVGGTEDALAVDGPLQVPVRVYRPPTASALLPTVVFFHGGGFVLGSVETADDIARKLCAQVNAVVVSVEYRLAPEHPYPAAHDDALAATRWALGNAQALGGDAARVAVAGESAGANLAASTALRLRDEGVRLAAQLLVVPGVDVARDTSALPTDTPLLTAADLRAISRLLMGGRPELAAGFPPSPLRAPSLAGSPPAVIALAGHDPLQGEGEAYARRLQADGVPVDLMRFPDMFHPFFGFFAASAAACRAHDLICRAFRARLHSPLPLPSQPPKETP
ncbi:alpha/beta hydrolase [Ramlibacter sp. AW1]|uniref:Alpha/beta hydrolase n=1 Tax=Ramlibacter aurantiacus TaxID=2801330 RepID=A0A936ZZK2_9BURK|nr:alpha/beta hydrolase [Ramlibacter aurantiacus]MBL0423344.1 alpha/beta hydrolase [Ramlibacter aurantiacus]